MSQWIDICRIDDIPARGARVAKTVCGDIAIFRNGNDLIFALEDRCPHRGGPLSQGIVHGENVTCPLHGWVIELAKGTAMAPDVGCTRSFPVRVENGVVSLDLGVEEKLTPIATEKQPAPELSDH